MNRWNSAAMIAGAVGCATLVLLLSDSSRKTRGGPMQDSASQLPTIRLTLGDDIQTIQRQSTYVFPRPNLGRIDIIAADRPIVFDYTRVGCTFKLPPARSFGAAMNDGHAVSVTVSPQLGYVSVGEALELIERVNALLRKSNWKVSKQYFTPDQIRSRFEDPARDSDYTIRVSDWRCGADEVYIELARHWRQGESLPQLGGKTHDLLVVSVKIENDIVRAQYSGR
jgi:hypothetical protein